MEDKKPYSETKEEGGTGKYRSFMIFNCPEVDYLAFKEFTKQFGGGRMSASIKVLMYLATFHTAVIHLQEQIDELKALSEEETTDEVLIPTFGGGKNDKEE